MNIELRGIVAAIAEKNFTGEDGTAVIYQELYFQYQEENNQLAVAKLNTKQDLKPHLGKQGLCKIAVQENGKLKLISFTAGRSEDRE